LIPLFSSYGLMVLALLLVTAMGIPYTKASLPRYATMGAPIMAILMVTALLHLGRWKVILSIPLIAGTLLILATSEYHGYIVRHCNWLKEDLALIPKRNDEYFAKKALYAGIKQAVDSVHGRVFFIMQNNDLLLPYRVGDHFAMAGIRAPLISHVQTCPPEFISLAGRVEEWVLTRAAQGPPPAGMNPATDFLFFPKGVVLGGRHFEGLVKLDTLLTGH
jgi:hypothetical protein